MLGTLLELFAWVGFVSAALLLLVLGVVRLVDGAWLAADAAVVAVDGRLTAIWTAGESGTYSRALDDDEAADVSSDPLPVYYSARSPERMRLDRLSAAERVLRLLFWLMLAVGVVASGAGLVVLLFAV